LKMFWKRRLSLISAGLCDSFRPNEFFIPSSMLALEPISFSERRKPWAKFKQSGFVNLFHYFHSLAQSAAMERSATIYWATHSFQEAWVERETHRADSKVVLVFVEKWRKPVQVVEPISSKTSSNVTVSGPSTPSAEVPLGPWALHAEPHAK